MPNFKVYLTIEGSAEPEEIRKFTIGSDVVINFLHLKEKLQSIFPILCGKQFVITYKDLDRDSIIISNDEELRLALADWRENTQPNLFVILRSDEDKNMHVRLEEKTGILHKNIVCDGCNKNVKGFRYKCMECPDYDLCSRCEGKGLHPEHCMLRTAEPLQWSSRHGRLVAHRLKKFIRNSSMYTGKVESAQECLATKERHRRCRIPVIDLADFCGDQSDYTNECPMKSNASKPPETATEATASCEETQKTQTELIDLLKYFENTILNHLGIEVNLNVKDEKKSDPKPNNGATNPAESNGTPIVNEKFGPKTNNSSTNQANSKEAPIVNEQSAPKPNNASTSKADSKGAPVANEKSNITLDDDDEWTILIKEKLSDSDASDTVQTLHRPPSSSNRTDENMQQEVITPSAPVKEPSNGNLYPPLPLPAAPKPVAQPVAPQPIVYHPNPKIQSAVTAMMDMGFSNAHGTLTQLLVLNDGNINKVLDMLSPI